MLTSAFVALSFVASAFGAVFITSPTASSTFAAGKNATISWKDDGAAPSLAQFGPSKIAIYAGNRQQQTLLQEIAPNVDVSKASAVVFVPNAQIGPNFPSYFIRFDSLSLKDTANPQYAALAFSAKFALSGMTGQFSPAIQAQIDSDPSASTSVSLAVASTTSSAAPRISSTTSSRTSSTTSARPSSSGAASHTLASAGSIGLAGIFVFLTNLL